MEEKERMLEELHSLNAAAERARLDYYAKAIRLADEVVRNKSNIGDIRDVIADLIREYEEADGCYTNAVAVATEACARLSQFLYSPSRKGDAK